MSSPQELDIRFRIKDIDYHIHLVKGEKSDQCVQINGISYAVLGDQDKLETACKILNSVSLDAILSSQDLIERVSLREDVTLAQVRRTKDIGTHTLQTVSSSTPGIDRLNHYLDELNKTNFYSGIVLIAVGDKVIRHEAIAPKGLEQKKFTTESPFNTLSVGKIFTAVAIMQLVERGNIRLDQPINELLTSADYALQGCDQGYERDKLDNEHLESFCKCEKITVDHLLTHTAGLIESPNDPTQFDEKRLGKEYIYSNLGFLLLARIVSNHNDEKVPFLDYVKEHILKPSGIADSLQYIDSPPEKSAQPSHFNNNRPSGNAKEVESDHPIPPPDGNGCFWMTSSDLLKFTVALRKNLLLDQKHKKMMQNPVISDHARGFEVAGSGTEKDPHRMMKGGAWEGASSGLCIIEGKEAVTLVCLSNLSSGNDILPEMCNVLINEEVPIQPFSFREELRKIYLTVKSLDIQNSAQIQETINSIQPPSILGEILIELDKEQQHQLISAILLNLSTSYKNELRKWLTETGFQFLMER